ncbi:MAG: hypothetical protein HYS07_06100 [Chlamydiae bacterium]|nr:hypothetical protein [Chlamydiota bacterium]MBI3277222.1 hypothetical protein [Chlamydiota bacterium]
MSQKGIEQLIGKALVDKQFLEDFLKNPEGKVKEAGFDVSSEELGQLKKVDAVKARQFSESFAKEFGKRQQAIGIPFL